MHAQRQQQQRRACAERGAIATWITGGRRPGQADLRSRRNSTVLAGTCAAVDSYVDGSGNQQGLLLSEVARLWAAGAKAAITTSTPLAAKALNPAVRIRILPSAVVTAPFTARRL